jgi:dTDP-4-amino-4,6-dideoxygalactose transaminase
MLDRFAPLPRLMLYTSPAQYRRVLGDVAGRTCTTGNELDELERTIQSKLGVANAISMPLARVAIYATLKALIKPGQKVICSPYTIADVINMIVCAGGVPLFADIERETCNINPTSIESLIDSDTGAVLVTHFYGLVCDVERIGSICRARGVPMIEDAAQAFGASLGGRPSGTHGTAGIYSFGMYKNVNAFFGGMVVSDDDGLAARIRAEITGWPYQSLSGYLRKVASALATDFVTHPLVFRTLTFWLFRWAFLNGVDAINNRLKIDVSPTIRRELPADYQVRMMPMQARLILSQLDGVDSAMQARIGAAIQWHEGLNGLPGLLLPPLHLDGSHAYWHFPVQFDRRHDLVAFVQRHCRDITESYHRNCAALPCFEEFARACPNAEATANSLIYLPTYPRYGAVETARTIKVIRAYFGK